MELNFISVIIPTKDRGEIFQYTLLKAYEALLEHRHFEIIVVNDSKTNEIQIPDELKDKAKIINNPKSGVASARNLGVSMSKGNWLLFLDDDMVMNRNNVNTYLNYCDRNDKFCVNIEWVYPPEITAVLSYGAFGRFLVKYGFTTMRGWNNYPDWNSNASISVNSVASPNLFMSKTSFLSTKGYDENFPYAGFEDYVFSERLKENGFKMYVDTRSCMFHNESDRLDQEAWFARKKRDGETRKIAVKLGFDSIQLKYGILKNSFYATQSIWLPVVKSVLFFTTPFKLFDLISFKCFKLRLGMAIYKGYTSVK